jgi:hypothetical protein
MGSRLAVQLTSVRTMLSLDPSGPKSKSSSWARSVVGRPIISLAPPLPMVIPKPSRR